MVLIGTVGAYDKGGALEVGPILVGAVGTER